MTFEEWYASYNPAHKSDKERAEDAWKAATSRDEAQLGNLEAKCNPQEASVSLPWGDCKVAFDFGGDVDALWDSFDAGEHKLPGGWSLKGTNSEGARLVVIFRVDGDLLRADGDVVAKLLRSIEQANAALTRRS